MSRKKLSLAAYALALACFLMPFLEVSCQGRRLASFTGLQLAVGVSLNEPQMFGPARKREVSPDLLIVTVLGLTVLGLAFGLRGGSLTGPGGAAGLISSVLLLVFKAKTDNAVASQAEELLQTHYGFGYWAALLLSAAGGALALATRRAETAPEAETATPEGAADPVRMP